MKIFAYAKINLTLDVLSKREDGYHNLDSVMQTVSLHDTVFLRKSRQVTVKCKGISENENIALKAANAFFDTVGICGGVTVRICKRIPVSAGLGGGSSDAAAVILGLDRLYKTHLDKDTLIKIAVSVGADVPFLLFGATARVGGIGEKVERLTPIKNKYVILVKNADKISTKVMYEKIDGACEGVKTTPQFCEALNNGNFDASFVANAFYAVSPQEKLFSDLSMQNPLCVSLSGSGPTMFAVFDKKTAVKSAAKALLKSGYRPIVTKFE